MVVHRAIQVFPLFCANATTMLNHTTNNGTGPDVILVHGNSMDLGVWSKQLSDPSLKGLNLIAVDLPGHGASSRYPADRAYTVDAFADDVADFVRSRDRPYLVGHSLGGHIGMRVLQRCPTVRGIVLMGTPPLRGTQDLPAAYLPHPALMKAFQADLSESDASALAEAYGWHGSLHTAAITRMVLNTDRRVRADLGQQMATGQFDDEQAMLHNATVPACVVHGAQDPLIATAYLEGLAPTYFWQGRVHLIPDAGHTPQLQRPDAFARLMPDFVAP